jgi:Na+-translocating ferredoxin:NAD+ oxidoreductase RnfG subunit
MFHIQRLTLSLLLLLAAAAPASAQDYRAKMQAAFKRVFGESVETSAASVRADAGSGPMLQYYSVASGGKLAGYGIIDEVRGKTKLITYALIVDRDLVIKDLEVLAYREPYGGEIQYEAFRRQFRGKGTHDPLKVGSDIRNISGATISSNAVTNGVHRLIGLLKELKSAGKIH